MQEIIILPPQKNLTWFSLNVKPIESIFFFNLKQEWEVPAAVFVVNKHKLLKFEWDVTKKWTYAYHACAMYNVQH